MPELPDVTVYVEALNQRIVGQVIRAVAVRSPFLVRTTEPPFEDVVGRAVVSIERLGKRIILELDDDLFVVIHLMIAGRFRWMKPGAKSGGKIFLGWLDFDAGRLALTEAGTRKRASLHVVRGADALAQFDRGGLEVLDCSLADFRQRLQCENHTLKRSLSAPHLFSGIGNAYSDEILHAAGLSPLAWSTRLSDDEIERLYTATQAVLTHWITELQARFARKFPGPGDITAFREGFATHGRFDQPCPVCNTKIQRIRYADRETNYCPKCQTGGKILADRSLSRLLKDDWPKQIEDE